MKFQYKIQTVSVSVSEPIDREAEILGDPEVVGRFVLDLLKTMDADQEHFILLALDGVHRLTGMKVLSSGTRVQTLVDPARLWRVALELDAAGVIVAHNHPSGQLEPSRDDIELTRRIHQGGEIIGISLFDHIIVGQGQYLSLRNSRPGMFKGAV